MRPGPWRTFSGSALRAVSNAATPLLTVAPGSTSRSTPRTRLSQPVPGWLAAVPPARRARTPRNPDTGLRRWQATNRANRGHLCPCTGLGYTPTSVMLGGCNAVLGAAGAREHLVRDRPIASQRRRRESPEYRRRLGVTSCDFGPLGIHDRLLPVRCVSLAATDAVASALVAVVRPGPSIGLPAALAGAALALPLRAGFASSHGSSPRSGSGAGTCR